MIVIDILFMCWLVYCSKVRRLASWEDNEFLLIFFSLVQ